MRKVALAVLAMSALIFSSAPVSQAALNAQVNLDNPRVVPIFGQDGPSEVRLMAGWSGFQILSLPFLQTLKTQYTLSLGTNCTL